MPERLKPDEDREPWTIEFAREQPISVSFADGGFSVTLRGQHYLQGGQALPGNERHGRLQAGQRRRRFQGGPPGRGADLPAQFRPRPAHAQLREETIHTLLQRRLGKVLEPEMVAKGFTPKGKWAAVENSNPWKWRAGRLAGDRLATRGGGKDRLHPLALRQLSSDGLYA